MLGTGLPTQQGQVPPMQLPPRLSAPTLGSSVATGSGVIGGAMAIQSVASMQAAQSVAEAALQDQQAQPVITGLAGHIKSFFSQAETAKLDVQTKMLEAMYARRGEYPADKLAKIKEQGQPVIYMMLPSVKMRQAESLLRDVVIGSGAEKPWTLRPTEVPDLPVSEVQKIYQGVTAEVEQVINLGLEPTLEAVRERLESAKTELTERVREEATLRCARMEEKMEDQLQEGSFDDALDQFITDLTTFKAAFISGPIVKRKPKLSWGPGNEPVVTIETSLEWERVDPFDMYPAPWARHINDGPLVRKHRLTRSALTEMIGVEGYSEPAIRKVLELYGLQGLNEWNQVDSQKARAEGKLMTAVTTQSGLIDALQYWGSVSGAMLRQWGMTEKQVPDAAKEYQVEAWSIGAYVIKAVLNSDPLARRPYYSDCYENIPGSVWGNSVYDLMRDCADMCNSAARSLAANLGISSGPQVAVNVDRLPPGEQISQMYPWKIWQVTSDPMGSTAKPIDFFQPQSNATELMGVFSAFSELADEYTGIPKYTVGAESTGGAGRTASGMSMMLGNASKIIRAVIASIDIRVFTPLLERLYYYNMRFSNDPDLKGDVRVVARGALSMAVKESAQQARAQFLQATNNPTDMQIIGLEGRAEVLRATLSTLDMDPDKIVPPVPVLKDRQALVQKQQAQAAQAGSTPGANVPPTAAAGGAAPGAPGQAPQVTAPAVVGPGQALIASGGAAGPAVTDHFQPQPNPA